MSITIRYNGSSIHLQGIAASTPYTGNGDDNETGVVAYYAESACGSLTRNGYRMATGKTFETATEALEGAREMASYSHGLKVCKNCEKAAQLSAETETPETPEAEAPAIDDHAAAVAQMRANREAEEEERAAARRARNRTNYAPAPEAREDTTITREPEDRTLTEVEEMEDEYQDLVHVGRGLRLLSDQFCRLLAEMKDGEGLDEDHPRFRRIKRKLDRNLKLEDKNLAQRGALSLKIREARGQGRCLQRGGEYGGPSLQCLQLRGHTGDCKNSRGETFTNWLDPEERMTSFTSKSPVLVMDAETAPEVKAFHRKIQDAIGFKF